MARPLFGHERERAKCYLCNELAVIPPGEVVDDMRLCKGCAVLYKQQQISLEVIEPTLTETEDVIQSLLENMGPMVP